MKFKAQKKNLLDGLASVTRALSNKHTEVILQGIYLKAISDEKGDRLLMVGTDMDIRMELSVPVEVIEEGDTIVPGKEFYQYIRKMPDVPLLFDHVSKDGDDTMTVSYGDAKGVIKGFPGRQFPGLADPEGIRYFSMKGANFRDIFQYTGFTINPEEMRPIFTGLLFHVEGETLTCVGTDSYRLAKIECPIDHTEAGSEEIVVPLKILQEVDRFCGLYEDIKFSIGMGNQRVYFDSDEVRISGANVRGEFPPYDRVIPHEYDTFIKVDRKAFIESLDRATLFSQMRDGTAVCHLNIDGGVLSIHTESDAGRVDEYVDVYMEGPALDITFNAKFISDALKALPADVLELYFTGGQGPVVMKEPSREDYVYLLLPLRR